MRYLLNTNVISELVARQPNLQVVQWLDDQDVDSVYLSVITIGEFRKGIEKLPDSARKEKLGAWLTDDLLLRFDGHILSIDTGVMMVWGELTGRLEQIGRPLPAVDSLVAALTLHNNCTLVTRNEGDFADTGVTIFNPWR